MISSSVGVTVPPRVAAIISRFEGPARSNQSNPAGSVDFYSALEAETQRQKAVFEVSPPTTHSGVLPGGMAYSTTPLSGRLYGSSGQANAVIKAASRHLGVPYQWGGNNAAEGFDCSGLVKHAFAEIGVEMPRWSRHQATQGTKVDSLDDARPGDLLAFGEPVNHVALYVGDGQMLHAPKTGDVVRIGPIDRPITAIRRIVDNPPLSQNSRVASGIMSVASRPWNPANDAEAGYIPLFVDAGHRWGVDPALLAAVASAESGFNALAQSPAGAQGLMQFMPATAAEMGVDPWEPGSAIDGAARYLRKSLDQFGSVDLAVASYNAGRGAVANYQGIPPYAETRNYVSTVNEAWKARS